MFVVSEPSMSEPIGTVAADDSLRRYLVVYFPVEQLDRIIQALRDIDFKSLEDARFLATEDEFLEIAEQLKDALPSVITRKRVICALAQARNVTLSFDRANAASLFSEDALTVILAGRDSTLPIAGLGWD